MVRSTAREIAVHLSYELSFTELTADALVEHRLDRERIAQLAEECEIYSEPPGEKQRTYIARLVRGVAEHGAELDGYIEKYAVGWKFARIPLVASAIMRVAMFEILYMDDIPNAAAINEAVELGKKYESDEVVRFMNGILGAFVKAEVVSYYQPRRQEPAL